MTRVIRALLSVLMCVFLLGGQTKATDQADRPNIILIYADDLGAGLLGSYGQEIIKTPHLDRLAADGVTMSRAHGCTYCAPARASLLTGLHSARRGAWRISTGKKTVNLDLGKLTEESFDRMQSEPAPAHKDEIFLAQLAQQAGYTTAQFGKLDWGFQTSHNKLKRHGWDYYLGYYDHVRAHGYYPPYLWENGKKVMLEGNTRPDAGKTSEIYEPEVKTTATRRDKTGKAIYSQNVFIQHILQYIRDHKDERFFLYHPTQIPHGPVDIPEVHPDFVHDKRLSDVEKEYASMVKLLDDHIGMIMNELKEQGIDDKTLVIFTVDNGHEYYYIGKDIKRRTRQREFRDFVDVFQAKMDLAGTKWTSWQGGISVPMIARWPGNIPAGTTSTTLSANYDLMPTLADVMGVDCPPGKDGVSILASWQQGTQPDRGHIVFAEALILGDWKYVRHEKERYLFNLKDDPGERVNLATKFPEKLQELQGLFQQENVRRRDIP